MALNNLDVAKQDLRNLRDRKENDTNVRNFAGKFFLHSHG